jgi:cytidylate kinase
VEAINMKKPIITISREFGSGGRSIGKAVAERLGIPYYDKDLVEQVAVETGFDPAYIAEHGEYAPSKSMFAYAFSHLGTPGIMDGLSSADYLWVKQRQVILDLAEKGPCVIVGRGADYILKDREDCLHVFIHAPKEFRAERIVRLYGESEKSPEKRLDEKDGKRKVNYKHYTGEEWGMSRNYDISLNSGIIGVEKCVDIIVGLVED